MASKQLRTVQFISRNLGACFASVAYDFKHWGLSTDHIIESTVTDIASMEQIVVSALENFEQAKGKYHQQLRPIFWSWLCCVDHRRGVLGVLKSYQTLFYYIRRNGLAVMDVLDLVSLFHVFRSAWSVLFRRK